MNDEEDDTFFEETHEQYILRMRERERYEKRMWAEYRAETERRKKTGPVWSPSESDDGSYGGMW